MYIKEKLENGMLVTLTSTDKVKVGDKGKDSDTQSFTAWSH